MYEGLEQIGLVFGCDATWIERANSWICCDHTSTLFQFETSIIMIGLIARIFSVEASFGSIFLDGLIHLQYFSLCRYTRFRKSVKPGAAGLELAPAGIVTNRQSEWAV